MAVQKVEYVDVTVTAYEPYTEMVDRGRRHGHAVRVRGPERHRDRRASDADHRRERDDPQADGRRR